MLEKPIDATTIMQLKADMVNKTNFVEKRAGIILEDTLQGHYEVSLPVLTFDSRLTCLITPTLE